MVSTPYPIVYMNAEYSMDDRGFSMVGTFLRKYKGRGLREI
jgi:hypothetical protein